MSYRVFTLRVLLFLAAASLPALAQQDGIAIGPKAGMYLERGNVMLGLIGEVPLADRWSIVPGLEYISGLSETTRLVLDGNLHYSIPLRGTATRPFLLGGLGLRMDFYAVDGTSSGSIRVNLGAGVVFSADSPIQPWAGLKVYMLDVNSSDACLQGGVNFVL